MNPPGAILIVIVGILGVFGFLHAPSLAAPVYQYPVLMGIDFEACQEECRVRWGVELWGAGGGGGRSGVGVFYGLARCVEKCKLRYWKEFDKESEELLD